MIAISSGLSFANMRGKSFLWDLDIIAASDLSPLPIVYVSVTLELEDSEAAPTSTLMKICKIQDVSKTTIKLPDDRLDSFLNSRRLCRADDSLSYSHLIPEIHFFTFPRHDFLLASFLRSLCAPFLRSMIETLSRSRTLGKSSRLMVIFIVPSSIPTYTTFFFLECRPL